MFVKKGIHIQHNMSGYIEESACLRLSKRSFKCSNTQSFEGPAFKRKLKRVSIGSVTNPVHPLSKIVSLQNGYYLSFIPI